MSLTLLPVSDSDTSQSP